jgi:hypothetical protein
LTVDRGKVFKKPVGGRCWNDFTVRQAFPLLTDEQYDLACRQSPAFKKSVTSCRDVLDGKREPDWLTSASQAITDTGMSLKAQYLVFSPAEFLTAFKVPYTDIEGLKLTTITNEEEQVEQVVVMRNPMAPRVLEVTTFVGNRLVQDFIRTELRADQGIDQHKAMVKQDFDMRSVELRSAGRMDVPDQGTVLKKVAAVIEQRQKDGIGDVVGQILGDSGQQSSVSVWNRSVRVHEFRIACSLSFYFDVRGTECMRS